MTVERETCKQRNLDESVSTLLSHVAAAVPQSQSVADTVSSTRKRWQNILLETETWLKMYCAQHSTSRKDPYDDASKEIQRRIFGPEVQWSWKLCVRISIWLRPSWVCRLASADSADCHRWTINRLHDSSQTETEVSCWADARSDFLCTPPSSYQFKLG